MNMPTYCQHEMSCPLAERPDHAAAHTVASHPEQGWSLLCNGVIVFDDYGELLPDGRSLTPQRCRPVTAGQR
jgi:hypothetical protein